MAQKILLRKMKKPHRVQRRRTRGWRMPENTVYVGRPSKFGNEYMFSGKPDYEGRAIAVLHFQKYVLPKINPLELFLLKGKNLACWCPLNQPCHADILLEVING